MSLIMIFLHKVPQFELKKHLHLYYLTRSPAGLGWTLRQRLGKIVTGGCVPEQEKHLNTIL